MQLQHQVKKALPGGAALIVAGVRVDVTQLAAALPRRRGEEDPRNAVTVHTDPQHGDGFAFNGFDFAHQFGRGQDAAVAFFDLKHRRIEQVQQLVLKRYGGAGNAHQGQNQPCGYPEKPVQLKQDVLKHDDRLARSMGGAFTQKPRPLNGRGLFSAKPV